MQWSLMVQYYYERNSWHCLPGIYSSIFLFALNTLSLWSYRSYKSLFRLQPQLQLDGLHVQLLGEDGLLLDN